MTRAIVRRVAAVALAVVSCAMPRYDAQVPLPAAHNFAFRRADPDVDALFNAFDYGHATVYERLVQRRDSAHIERDAFEYVTRRLLHDPPRVPLDEGAVGPLYVRLAPELRATFEWAHTLHRQLYDVCADRRLTPVARDSAVAAVMRYYRSRRDLALSVEPKPMELMESGPYALGFRRAHPRYNGLLWSYHWLQLALYDALLDAATPGARDANVHAVVARFWAQLVDAPRTTPAEMPMAEMVAPTFAERWPDAANVFDNLHALHDVAADILAAPGLSTAARRRLLLDALAMYQDRSVRARSAAAR